MLVDFSCIVFVKDYERVLAMVPSSLQQLLAVHMDDLDRKIAPGVYLLSWSSVNIDAFLRTVRQVAQQDMLQI
jgi:dynein heavy chain, axonemal